MTTAVTRIKQQKRVIYLAIIILAFFVAQGVFLFAFSKREVKENTEFHAILPLSVIKIAETEITVEVAKTRDDIVRGLSGRTSLSRGRGMLFVHDKPGLYAYWMKEMKISIDILWISSDGQIIDIAENVVPESYPQTFAPSRPARYVLEVPAGFSREAGLLRGVSVDMRNIQE
jgi:uncharacterized protein